MWRWRRVAVARVFALVVRCRVMLLLLNSRVGKNRDTSGGPRREPGQAVAPATKPPLIYPIVAPRSANDIYRPVSGSLISWIFP
jgi:hypothetical protein